MTEQFDIVVAGAGHNSLLAAAYLAKAGFRCLVLEAEASIGGDTATEELTIPGFRHDSCSTAHNLIQSSPTMRNDELKLGEYGLEYVRPDPAVHVPFPDGSWITQWRDLDRTCHEFAKFSPADAATYRRMMEEYRSVGPAYADYRYTPIGWGPTLTERLATRPDGAAWLEVVARSSGDVIMEAFEHPHTRAFMLWMATLTLQPLERPGTGILAYSLAAGRQINSWVFPRGGSSALPDALGRLIEEHGGVIQTGTRVARLLVESGRCVGVETENGDQFRASRGVLSTIHIKHLIDMAPADDWDPGFSAGVDRWQPGVTLMAAYYSTSEAPRFQVDGGTISPVAVGLPTSPDRMLRTTEEFESGHPDTHQPVVLALCPSVADETRAPPDHHTVKILLPQPYELVGGPGRWDEIKEEVAGAALQHLRDYAPNLTDETILASEVKSPLDLERRNAHNWRGSCHGGDLSPDQTGDRRPVPGWAQHRLPMTGLYQTGATTHPGGSVSGAPGRNAAAVMLADLGTSIEEVVGVR
ncbi:MAG: phytoene desaturase family protein [Acidimicrobiia bacterium]